MSTDARTGFFAFFANLIAKDAKRAIYKLRMPLLFISGVLYGALLMFVTMCVALRTDATLPTSVSASVPQHTWTDVLSLVILLTAGTAFWAGSLLRGRGH